MDKLDKKIFGTLFFSIFAAVTGAGIVVPLLPVYAWLGAVGTLPDAFLVLVPLGAVAGAALAIGNALVDVDRDRAAQTPTPAVALGPTRAWRALASLHSVVSAVALASLLLLGGSGPGILIALAGVIVSWGGVFLDRGESAAIRERGWELQAVGVAMLAAGWVLAIADGGR